MGVNTPARKSALSTWAMRRTKEGRLATISTSRGCLRSNAAAIWPRLTALIRVASAAVAEGGNEVLVQAGVGEDEDFVAGLESTVSANWQQAVVADDEAYPSVAGEGV
jgi:hypothetical protein